MSSVSQFAVSAYLPSLPFICDYFNAPQKQAELTITAFFAGFGCSQIFYGPFSEIFGRRKIIILGFILFLAGMTLCTMSISIEMLIFARLVAGLGAGVSSSLNRAVTYDLFQDYRIAKANAAQGNAVALTMLLGPLVGGYSQQYFDWRVNLFFIFIYVGFVLLAILRILPNTNDISKNSISIKIIVQNYLTLMRNKNFYRNVFYSTCALTGMLIFNQISSFLFMKVLSASAKQYGWAMIFIFFGYLFAGSIVNRTAGRIGMRDLLFCGIIISMTSGVFLLSAIFLNIINFYTILISAVLFVLGSRIIIPNAVGMALTALPDLSGYSASLIGVMQATGITIGSYIVTKLNFSMVHIVAYSYLILSVFPLFVFLIESDTAWDYLKRVKKSKISAADSP